ncbi:hypothetical protein [Maribacter sp. 4G9]|uniref:hypothetical protein n=1 Tax=Maribacter sp. 4G9 TaxID=1889777 RepID=UPI00197E9D1F|nr:hypothetical protein [Maribacter sp. 4G9]
MKTDLINFFHSTKSMCNLWLILFLAAQLFYPQQKQAVDYINPLIETLVKGFA